MNLTLRFELRKDTVNKKGEHPIFLIIRVASQRRKLTTNVKAIPELWDNENQRIKLNTAILKKELLKKYNEIDLPSNFEIKRSNIYLEEMSNGLEAIAARFELDGTAYSADMVLDKYKQSFVAKTTIGNDNIFIIFR